MSAAEIIEQIKTLPPEERDAVFEYVRQEDSQRGEGEVRYMDKDKFRAAKERVFATHRELLRRLAQ